MKHAADHEKQKGAPDTYDDRRSAPIAGEAGSFRTIANNAADDHGAKEGKKHMRLLELLTFGEREAPQEDISILRAFTRTLQAQELHRAVTTSHGQRVVQQFAR